jgi:pimeloyl-ACP methyl ester carboxylesterase
MPFLVRPDGCRINYEVRGDAGAFPILLLEGSGGDIPGWRRNIPHLSESLRVVAFDFRGNGLSDSPDEPQPMSVFVEDSIGVMDELKIDRAHIYGQSFGGMVAQEVALVHPDRVRTLVLACTHCGGSHVIRNPSRVPKAKPYLAMYSEEFAAAHPDHVAEDQRVARRQPRRPSHSGRRQWEAMSQFDTFDRLPQIEIPTLVLHGTADQVVDPENGRVLAERIPGAELVWLVGAGHLYHSEQADTADAAVLDFIERRGS